VVNLNERGTTRGDTSILSVSLDRERKRELGGEGGVCTQRKDLKGLAIAPDKWLGVAGAREEDDAARASDARILRNKQQR
jgi:general stress protein YciG